MSNETRVVPVAVISRIAQWASACHEDLEERGIASQNRAMDILNACNQFLSAAPPTDGAQVDDARDAARYRKLKKYVTIWESQLAETRGMISLSVEFDAVGDDLDAALDRIKDDSASAAISHAQAKGVSGE